MPTASKLVAGEVVVDPRTATVDYTRSNQRDGPRALQKLGLIGLQLLGLWTLNIAGTSAVQALALPIPGNLAGMILLYALLSLGIIKIAWLDAAGSLLVKHLAFFFIPVAVGVIDAGGLLASHVIAITFTLVASATVGIVLSGWVAQSLAGKSQRKGELS
jgi:holin-like protein